VTAKNGILTRFCTGRTRRPDRDTCYSACNI
jgi:hypothetical protein